MCFPVSDRDVFSGDRGDTDETLLLATRPYSDIEVANGLAGPTDASGESSRFGRFEPGGTRVRELMFRKRAHFARMARYAATSGLAFAISEAILLILVSTGTTGATVAALIANVAATIPSYLMSRYWIWKDAERDRVGRQVVLYWTTSVVCWILIALTTGAIAKLIPKGHKYHLALIGLTFLVVNAVFFVLKYAVYHKIIFPADKDADKAAGSDRSTESALSGPTSAASNGSVTVTKDQAAS
jgi:putative flippase GtrA